MRRPPVWHTAEETRSGPRAAPTRADAQRLCAGRSGEEPAQFAQGRQGDGAEIDRQEIVAPEPSKFEHLVAVSSLHASDGSCLVDDGDVRGLVSIGIRDSEPRAPESGNQTGDLYQQPRLLLGFANRRIRRSLVNLDGTADKAPQARVSMPDEQETIMVVGDEDAHRWHQQQLLPDPLPEQPHVVGHRHGETLGAVDGAREPCSVARR